jgi:hypothetical protein
VSPFLDDTAISERDKVFSAVSEIAVNFFVVLSERGRASVAEGRGLGHFIGDSGVHQSTGNGVADWNKEVAGLALLGIEYLFGGTDRCTGRAFCLYLVKKLD